MSKQKSIIKPETLLEESPDPDLVIIDCRFRLQDKDWGYQQYLHSHLPKAYYLDLEKDLTGLVEKHGGRHPLPDINQLAQKLGSLGIINQTRVIVYDDSRFAFAARLWWLLRYLGHDEVYLLDGGWNAWKNLNYPLESQIPLPRTPSIFTPSPRLDWTIEHSQVQQHLNSTEIVLIDSREEKRYRGEEEPIDPIAGHIPSAINSPYLQVTDSQGYLRQDQHTLWKEHLNSTKSLWVYCGSGVTACVNLFSLEQVGLLEKAKLYPGGWSDWCSYLTED